MIENERLKQIVKSDYSHVAKDACGCCPPGDFVIYDAQRYASQDGYLSNADMGLSCGCPVPEAGIMPGQTVVDLGCGGGLDVFIAEKITGSAGRVIGVDFTPAMIEKAKHNLAQTGLSNVEFVLSDIEQLSLDSGIADVVISNCVLNLVPDKRKAFREIKRILKPTGHFCISDMVTDRPWPEALKHKHQLYSSCISGAVPESDLISIIREAGFDTPVFLSRKKIIIPEDMIKPCLPVTGESVLPDIFSITLKASAV